MNFINKNGILHQGVTTPTPLQESRPEILGWLAKRNKDGINLYAHLVSPTADPDHSGHPAWSSSRK